MIECENLSKRFGSFTAVDHVSFKVNKGSIFGFLGPNGSGKIHRHPHALRHSSAHEGTARIAGIDVTNQARTSSAPSVTCRKKFSLYDELTTLENLKFYSRLYGLHGPDMKNASRNWSALTHLEPYLDRRAAQLSGNCEEEAHSSRRATGRLPAVVHRESTVGL